jgi:hypothetical protein
VVLGTLGVAHKELFKGTGYEADHAYTVLDHRTLNGKHYIKLRNPWDESEPMAPQGVPEDMVEAENDGVFWMDADVLTKWFISVSYTKDAPRSY